jgi:hypothetical protein
VDVTTAGRGKIATRSEAGVITTAMKQSEMATKMARNGETGKRKVRDLKRLDQQNVPDRLIAMKKQAPWRLEWMI